MPPGNGVAWFLLTRNHHIRENSKVKNIIVRTSELLMLALIFASGAALMGCEEGPVEEAGEEVDDALDDAGDELD